MNILRTNRTVIVIVTLVFVSVAIGIGILINKIQRRVVVQSIRVKYLWDDSHRVALAVINEMDTIPVYCALSETDIVQIYELIQNDPQCCHNITMITIENGEVVVEAYGTSPGPGRIYYFVKDDDEWIRMGKIGQWIE